MLIWGSALARILLDGPREVVLAKLSGRPQAAPQEKIA